MIENYIINKIKNANMIQEPFPHLIIDNLCPDDFFNTLKQEIPHDKEFSQYTRLNGRFGIDQSVWNNSWKDLKKNLYNEKVRVELLNRFEDILILRKEKESESDWNATLTVDTTNYKIAAHRDGPSKHLSTIFYITGGKNGTSLYKTRDHTYRTAQKVGEVDFVENRMFVFCGHPHGSGSWHGVEKASTPQKRYCVQAFLKLRNEPKTNWNSHGISIRTPRRVDRL